MGNEQNYIEDLAEIRSMMERSSKFLSLSGWAGIMAGIYALAGAWITYHFFGFNPDKIFYKIIESESESSDMPMVIILAILILILAIATAILLSYKKAHKRGEKIWNSTSRRLLANMAVPLLAGGIFILVLLSNDLIGLLAPSTLLFYGLALFNAGKFTYDEVKLLGMVQMILGLFGSYFIEYSLIFWSIGFGVVHIVYGIYMYFRYDR
jgi:hypothetical protein